MLGGMARELDSDVLRRLQEQYGQMSDGELVRLAGRPEELTDLALEVLRGEMTRRRLEPVKAETQAAEPMRPEFGMKPLAAGMVPLMTFYDAIEAGEAIRNLEQAGLEIDVRDVSDRSGTGGVLYGGPAVSLQVVVRAADRERAMALLREKMGLFPLAEVELDGEEPELSEEDGFGVVGMAGSREDAEEIARVVEEAGIWHRVRANEDGSVENEDAWVVEVKEGDLVRAGEVVDKAWG